MITKDNYLDKTQGLDVSAMPEPLQKGHAMAAKVAAGDWKMYGNENIRRTLDLYFEKFSSYLQAREPEVRVTKRKLAFSRDQGVKAEQVPSVEAEPVSVKPKRQPKPKGEPKPKAAESGKAKKEPKPKKERQAPKPKAGKPKREKASKPKKEKPKKEDIALRVNAFSKGYEVIRKFVNLDGKPRTLLQIRRFHQELGRLAIERRIKKGEEHAPDVQLIAGRVADLYKKMTRERIESVERLEIEDRPFLERMKKIVKTYRVSVSVTLIKQFIRLQGTRPGKEALLRLAKRVNKALTDDAVPKSDPYRSALDFIYVHLTAVLDKDEPVVISSTQLHGLHGLAGVPGSGLGCPGKEAKDCGCVSVPLAGVPTKKKAPVRKAVG